MAFSASYWGLKKRKINSRKKKTTNLFFIDISFLHLQTFFGADFVPREGRSLRVDFAGVAQLARAADL